MSELLAYADRQSLRPGDSIDFMISCSGAPAYRAEVLRLRAPDIGTGPDIPAVDNEILESPLSGLHMAETQTIAIGSWAAMARVAGAAVPSAVTLTTFVMPTLPGEAVLLSLVTATTSIELGTTASGHLVGRVRANGTTESVTIEQALQPWRWTFVALAYDGVTGSVRLLQCPIAQHFFDGSPAAHLERSLTPRLLAGGFSCTLAARCEDVTTPATLHFNGRLERPGIFACSLGNDALRALAGTGTSGPPRIGALADWDFSLEIGSDTVVDRSGHDRHGLLFNSPARAVQGSSWSGSVYDWRSAPEQYGAIHFHDDDLADAAWKPALRLEIPRDWRSGCYALRLSTDDGTTFDVPFFVRPAVDAKRADVVFLIPTMTYAAYANARFRAGGPETFPHELIQGRLIVVDDTELLLNSHPELGVSSYDMHRDGSAVHYASMRRPLVSYFRPTGRIYKFCQDLLIVAWLERLGVRYDIVTDEDLHREGVAALAGHRVVLTGSHPEYASSAMMNALTDHLNTGGRMMYLGGNGFYWIASYHPVRPGRIELRRGDPLFGRAFAGEQFTSLTGERGGMWSALSTRGHALTGVHLVAQGSDRCEGYQLAPDARRSRAGFAFVGVEKPEIGNFGLLAGGAAGYEIDRVDFAAGSPRHTLVLASSSRHSNVFDLTAGVPRTIIETAQSGADAARADMVFFETHGGGAVWSVGSIAWCGSLARDDYDNDVARVSANVLQRFVDPTPFAPPAQ